jgi:hypothetical protein
VTRAFMGLFRLRKTGEGLKLPLASRNPGRSAALTNLVDGRHDWHRKP